MKHNCRKAGLFPPDDPFLLKLLETEGLFPFEKHLSGAESPYEALKRGGWATGDAAASNGCDLRLFYKVFAAFLLPISSSVSIQDCNQSQCTKIGRDKLIPL